MISWAQLAELRPDLTEAGRSLLYPSYANVGLAYLATVRTDGGPRLHPMCPILNDEGLFALIVPGPKREDLRRDGRYALHSFPRDDDEDAFYLTGRASLVTDAATHVGLVEQFCAERAAFGLTPEAVADQLPFHFAVGNVMLTRTTGHGDPSPQHEIWHAPGEPGAA